MEQGAGLCWRVLNGWLLGWVLDTLHASHLYTCRRHADGVRHVPRVTSGVPRLHGQDGYTTASDEVTHQLIHAACLRACLMQARMWRR